MSNRGFSHVGLSTFDDATMRERFEVSIEALGLDKADEITSARADHEKAKHPQ